MPNGHYGGGELRLSYMRIRSAYPHVFELPWFPTWAGKDTQDEFDAQCGVLSRWLREHLPEESWRVEADGMQTREVRLMDDPQAVTEMRLRWT